jgi:hypothetical protein
MQKIAFHQVIVVSSASKSFEMYSLFLSLSHTHMHTLSLLRESNQLLLPELFCC